jgi:putative phage-type endonuclease
VEQRTPEWFDARAGKMTCSRMAEAVGLIGSRRRLWRELTGREGGIVANARMTDGINCEQIAVALYEQVRRTTILPAGFVTHPSLPWIGGSPDGLVKLLNHQAGPDGGLEVKCPVNMYFIVPEYYMPQIQGLMEVCNLGWWDFMAWTPDSYAITRVYRSQSYWQALYEAISDFWTYVDADVEPPIFKRGHKPRITAALVRTRLLHKEK